MPSAVATRQDDATAGDRDLGDREVGQRRRREVDRDKFLEQVARRAARTSRSTVQPELTSVAVTPVAASGVRGRPKRRPAPSADRRAWARRPTSQTSSAAIAQTLMPPGGAGVTNPAVAVEPRRAAARRARLGPAEEPLVVETRLRKPDRLRRPCAARRPGRRRDIGQPSIRCAPAVDGLERGPADRRGSLRSVMRAAVLAGRIVEGLRPDPADGRAAGLADAQPDRHAVALGRFADRRPSRARSPCRGSDSISRS